MLNDVFLVPRLELGNEKKEETGFRGPDSGVREK